MLRYYTSFKEMAREMRTIRRVTKPLANIRVKAAEDTIHFGINDGSKNKVVPGAKTKLAPKKLKEISQKSNDLDKLMGHQREVNNILNLLNNEFGSEEYPDKDKMVAAAKRLLDDLGNKILTLKKSLKADSQDTMPVILGKVANILKPKLDKEMEPICQSIKSNGLTGVVNDEPQHTIYFIYTNVQDDKGEITPQIVIALSYYNGFMYVNANLHDVIVPGKFKLDEYLHPKSGKTDTASPTELANLALHEINNQLAANSMLTAIPGSPIPFSQDKLKKLKPNNDLKMSFNKEADALVVSVSKKLPDAQVQEIANHITVQLNTLIQTDKNIPKMNIRYTKKKKLPPKVGWELTYKFVPAGKYNGKTIDQKNIHHLRQRFTDEEIDKMLFAIKNM